MFDPNEKGILQTILNFQNEDYYFGRAIEELRTALKAEKREVHVVRAAQILMAILVKYDGQTKS